MSDVGLGLLLLTAVPLVYILPIIVARRRGHRNAAAIAVVNLFLGWTLLGWVLALAWAVSADTEQRARS